MPKNNHKNGLEALAKIRSQLPKGNIKPETLHRPSPPKTENHNPVPFDFVPFPETGPELKTIKEWEDERQGELFSGTIEYALKTLTPLHIVGNQKKINGEIQKSDFFALAGRRMIPGYSIKGMIRSFMEAVTGGWVSQATDIHVSTEKDKKTYGFTGFSDPDEKETIYGPVIPHQFHPVINDSKIDLASFIFGMVTDKSGTNDSEKAIASRVIFEDVNLPDDIECKDIKLPDVTGTAFMGGPKPRINNWWYFYPKCIKPKSENQFAEFIGSTYRGRKFYYHQDYVKSFDFYDDPTEVNWPHKTMKDKQYVNNYRTYQVEAIAPGQTIFNARIDFERLPLSILKLLIYCVALDNNLAHKIGYAKAFGLGSVVINIEKVNAFMAGSNVLDEKNNCIEVTYDLTDSETQYIDFQAQTHLRRILNKRLIDDKSVVFTYPLYNELKIQDGNEIIKKTDFKKSVRWEKVQRIAKNLKIQGEKDRIPVTASQGRQIAEKLWSTKTAIDFSLYQEKSKYWPKILELAK